MAITDKKTGPWGLDQVYNKINQGSIWTYSGLSELWVMGGDNDKGQLGQNDLVFRSSPTQIPGSTWSQGEGTLYGSAVIRTDGTLWSWGYNIYGILGQNQPSNANYSSPVQIPGTNWAYVTVGQTQMAATKTDGTLWAWGSNQRGQLGQNQGPAQLHSISSPVQIPGTTWSKINTGNGRSFGIKTDGTAWSWGYNNYGYLAINSNTQRSSPVQIPGTTWKHINDGQYHASAVKTDGTLWTWGYEGQGALGQNNLIRYSSPVQIGGGTDWEYVASGNYTNFAVKTNGELWVWGYNNYGQLGVNSRTNYSSPIQLPGTWGTESGKIDADYFGHSFAVKTDGTLWTWGRDHNGELGQNSRVSKSSPVQVGSRTGWDKVGAGDRGALAFIFQ